MKMTRENIHPSQRKFAVILYLIIIANLFSYGQDLQFTQSFENPMFLNPSLTSCSKCSSSAGMIYRNQWTAINMPVKTYSAFLSTKYQPRYMNRDVFGFGAYFYNDAAGDGPLKTTGFVLNAALKKYLGWGRDTLYFSIGFSIGGGQRSLNFENLRFNSQWNGTGINNNLPVELNKYNNTVNFIDFGGGINLYYAPDKTATNYEVGISLMHINQPDMSFLKSGDTKYPLKIKMTFHGRIFKKITDHLRMMAGGLYSNQGMHTEILFGANFYNCITRNASATLKIGRKSESAVDFIYGLWLRMSPLRDIIPGVGLGVFGFNALLSYDIPMFNSAHVVNYKGSMEISITKNIGCKYKPKCNCKRYGF